MFQVIDDNDIGCKIPTEVHAGSTISVKMLTYLIRSCQLSGNICRQLMAAKAFDEDPETMLALVQDFDEQLCSWKTSLHSQVRPQDTVKHFHAAPNTRFLEMILIHCSYYNLLMVVHTLFAYPWIINSFEIGANSSFRTKIKAQVARSSKVVANAARNIIVMTRNFDINGACTHAYVRHHKHYLLPRLY